MHKTGQRQIIIEAKGPIDITSICLKTRKKNVYSSDSKRSAKKQDVSLNGQYLGNHKGAFNAFCFEITPYLKKKDNELIVKANNILNPDIAPLSGDFTIFGGIYRPVSLLILPQTCITPLDYASSGIYIKQTEIQDHKATIDITTKIDGDISGNKKLRLRTSVFDPTGKLVTTSENEEIRAFRKTR